MTPRYADEWLTVWQGDCRAALAAMPAASVHMVCTSPPYWGLRDYGTDGQLGLEATPEAYVEAMVEVFREVRRVLRPDATVWLNLGDSYASDIKGSGGEGRSTLGSTGNGMSPEAQLRSQRRQQMSPQRLRHGLKPKDLVGIPWRVAFALQADGWWLRSDIIWSKPNPMPESITDRPTKAHEYLFLLSPSARYFYDAEAVREGYTSGPLVDKPRAVDPKGTGHRVQHGGHVGRGGSHATAEAYAHSGRNLRSVWTIATEPYPGAHFATFPRKLVEPCIKAGTSERGVCPDCGAPWVRVVERTPMIVRASAGRTAAHEAGSGAGRRDTRGTMTQAPSAETTGWRPTCAHYPRTAEWPILPPRSPGESLDDYEARVAPVREHRAELLASWAPLASAPATVLDPFGGSGTVALVAQSIGRRAVLVELNPEYVDQAIERIAKGRGSGAGPALDMPVPFAADGLWTEAAG